MNRRFVTRSFYHYFVAEPKHEHTNTKTEKLFRTRTLKTANHAAAHQQLNTSSDRKRDSKCARNHYRHDGAADASTLTAHTLRFDWIQITVINIRITKIKNS